MSGDFGTRPEQAGGDGADHGEKLIVYGLSEGGLYDLRSFGRPALTPKERDWYVEENR